ncbi:MAG: preprotein translocase subunit SecA, partial [Planctomycetota bacterium]|nr:preprotein translocase subunit SecA [Planctomycetota bacterium]
LLVHHRYLRDRHYVVRDEEIVIVDEFTGRLSEGRCWRGGIHQAIQAKEGLPLTPDSGQAARVTMQNFFLQYDRLAGMTGTANHSEKEMSRIYRMKVQPIPTNRSPKRELLPDRIFSDQDQKWRAIAAEVRAIHETGQPVLVGTRSIDKSELLSRHLQSMGVEHEVLNASQELAEAEVIAKAGQKGQVTVATNMAGRGTDIRLGDGVKSLGGLYVIGTELHEAQRIDRQLMGRCGRQGDPGVFRQYLALDDDILRQGFGDRLANRWIETGRHHLGELHQSPRIFFQAQRKIEKRHFRQRRALMEREQQKQLMHEQMGQDPFLDAPE